MTSDGRKVVLLAEDDPVQQEVLQEFLEYEGYAVALASEPGEVLAQLAGGPDVVLLDLVGVTSPEVVRALAAAGPRRPGVVLLSAESQVAEVAERLGVDYLAKPYDLDELLRSIERAVARRPPAGAEESYWAGAP